MPQCLGHLMIYSACYFWFQSDSSLATDTGAGSGMDWTWSALISIHGAQEAASGGGGCYRALWGHTATQECVLVGWQVGFHFCVCHAETCTAGSATHTSPTPDWAGGQEKLRTCHRVSGKWNEDTVRKPSEIRSHCLFWEGGHETAPRAPVPVSLSKGH